MITLQGLHADYRIRYTLEVYVLEMRGTRIHYYRYSDLRDVTARSKTLDC